MSSTFSHLLFEQEDGIATITLNRPEVLNALNELLVEELTEVLETVADDEAVRCVVLTGAGRAFGAGQDLSAFTQAQEQSQPVKVSDHLTKYHRILYLLRDMAKPTLASIHGVAAGISANLAFACDLRLAADTARFIQAFARIGLVPDGGGAYFLPRLVGLGRALELAMLADEITGMEAERVGLVNKCVPAAELPATTHALALRLAQGPTRTYALIKELFYTSLDSDLPAVLTLEGELQDLAIQTADHREGVAAFLQKRQPRYTGN